MGLLEQILTVLLTSRRHKRYEQQANIRRVSPPTLGTQIRSTEQDYSHMFKGF